MEYKMIEEQVLFDERFLEKYIGGKLLSDPISATIELIANSWDAGATNINISWPSEENGNVFEISDNGAGISKNEFDVIWKTLSYNRVKNKGVFADDANGIGKKRLAFGRNGIGRFAVFCFGPEYVVFSRKNHKEIQYLVKQESGPLPFKTILIDEKEIKDDSHGSRIQSVLDKTLKISEEDLRSEIGMRFIADPEFLININNKLLTIEDISAKNIKEDNIVIEGLGTIVIYTIDTLESDKTTKLHGLAWRVRNRLVGDISWDYLSREYNVDGRRLESKRYSFIIMVDFAEEYVLPDWSGFDPKRPETKIIEKNVFPFIWDRLISLNKDKRAQELQEIKKGMEGTYKKMTPIKQERWESFIGDVQLSCPSLTQKELTTMAEILAKLELTSEKYALLDNLNQLESGQLTDLNEILEKWTVDYAKIVLDEIKARMELLSQLESKLYSKKADEVHELQPLFHRGLWIFGPEYETIEYTSNQGMTEVIQELYKLPSKGSKNRPDFAILSDSTVGLYSYPKYDNEGGEVGIDCLTIVELKAPGIPLKEDEIEQPWKYVKELYKHGAIQENITRVTCFIVGQSIDKYESGERKKANDSVVIKPLTYDTVIRRAKSRLFKLYDRMKNAPFMTKVDSRYTEYFDKVELQPELAVAEGKETMQFSMD